MDWFIRENRNRKPLTFLWNMSVSTVTFPNQSIGYHMILRYPISQWYSHDIPILLPRFSMGFYGFLMGCLLIFYGFRFENGRPMSQNGQRFQIFQGTWSFQRDSPQKRRCRCWRGTPTEQFFTLLIVNRC